ncbi:hypothetical protein E2C01_016874 [Portunus trituberculatus]|uniref:Uncharacterized protein n=1 Tax=Portunus trituberculatus TaxID=210409 RepID=A0A5B7DRU0_PORTR|nr:hypothetical protein [Portunus trituberculatus]
MCPASTASLFFCALSLLRLPPYTTLWFSHGDHHYYHRRCRRHRPLSTFTTLTATTTATATLTLTTNT